MNESSSAKVLYAIIALLACAPVFTLFLIFGGTVGSLIIAVLVSLTVVLLTVKVAKRYLLVNK